MTSKWPDRQTSPGNRGSGHLVPTRVGQRNTRSLDFNKMLLLKQEGQTLTRPVANIFVLFFSFFIIARSIFFLNSKALLSSPGPLHKTHIKRLSARNRSKVFFMKDSFSENRWSLSAILHSSMAPILTPALAFYPFIVRVTALWGMSESVGLYYHIYFMAPGGFSLFSRLHLQDL